MRPHVAMLLKCLIVFQALFATSVRGEGLLPYKATVIADNVCARSGPGTDYYSTDPLRRGQTVEVYRRNANGWCAIRPVEGSFTWVSARCLRPTRDRLAVVTDEGVAARVGSRTGNAQQDVVQVRLHEGEVVEIIEAPRDGDWDKEDGWCKIAPPSGEFRWVAAQDVVESSNDGVASEKAGGGKLSPDEAMQARLAEARGFSHAAFQAELERAELDVSIMATEDPTRWSFDALRERTNVLLSTAQTASERGRARLLAERIDQFEDIRQRRAEVLARREQTERSGRLMARLYPGAAEADAVATQAARFETDGRFDGTGQLIQVSAAKPGAPRYALANDAGEVLCYVTAAPGVNLYGYLGHRVGLVGTRGYMPEQRATHIMAKHITPLDGRNMLR